MAGKSKAQRKKKSQVKKRLNQELQTQVNQRKKKKDEEVAEVLATNGAEPEPPKVDEDAGKDIPMETLEENVRRMEAEKEEIEDEAADLQLEIDTEPKPFDPKSLIANILKKKKD